MAGVRIYHPTVRSETLALNHDGGPNRGKDHRGLLNSNRKAKTYTIDVDSNGFALVSPAVWTRIQQAQAGGAVQAGLEFTYDSDVPDPPAINFESPGPGQELWVPNTKLLDANGLHDVTGERLQNLKDVAQGLAPKGVTVKIAVRKGAPGAGNNGGRLRP